MGKQFTVFVSNTPKQASNKENVPPPNSPIALKPFRKQRTPLKDLTVDEDHDHLKKFVFTDSNVVKERKKPVLKPAQPKLNNQRMVMMR